MREKEGGGESKRSFEIQRGRRSTVCEDKAGRMGGELRKKYRGREEEREENEREKGEEEDKEDEKDRERETINVYVCTCV